MVVSNSMEVFIGNEVTDRLELCGNDLFGFNTGNYEHRIVSLEQGTRHPTGLAWRFGSDCDLVCFNKKLIPLCKLFQMMATEHGLAEITLPEHVVTSKMHPVEPWKGFNIALNITHCVLLTLQHGGLGFECNFGPKPSFGSRQLTTKLTL